MVFIDLFQQSVTIIDMLNAGISLLFNNVKLGHNELFSQYTTGFCLEFFFN